MAQASGQRKPRDHKAENARRNALAAERGYTNRYQQRKAIETGKRQALQPSRVKSERTEKAQARFTREQLNRSDRPRTYQEGLERISREQRCMDWASYNARTTAVQYLWDERSLESRLDKKRTASAKEKIRYADWKRPSSATNRRKRAFIKKHGESRYTEIYFYAFVEGDQRYSELRTKPGGIYESEWLRLWFIEVTGYMSADEFERRYGVNGTADIQ